MTKTLIGKLILCSLIFVLGKQTLRQLILDRRLQICWTTYQTHSAHDPGNSQKRTEYSEQCLQPNTIHVNHDSRCYQGRLYDREYSETNPYIEAISPQPVIKRSENKTHILKKASPSSALLSS
jgi:hypothetical protein